jgi:hypothetical protein
MTLGSALAAAVMLLSGTLLMTAGAGRAAPAHDGWHLQEPWPAASDAMAIQGQPVTFASSSPFTPRDALRAEPTTAIGTLYLPPGIGHAPPRSSPAVVLLHGAGGVLRPLSFWLDVQRVAGVAQRQGMSSSMRLFDQPLTRRVSRSVR